MNIPCDYLTRDRSDRAERLFQAIAPFLKPDMSYLDIGCGSAPLTYFLEQECPPGHFVGIDLDKEAVAACSLEYPRHTWLCIKSNTFPIERSFDVVIHTGINAPRFDDGEIHRRLLSGHFVRPRTVLLESGDYHASPSDTRPTYEMLIAFYRDAGYVRVRGGVFEVSCFPVPVRTFAVLRLPPSPSF
jgi:SAM-dependent methyltransferase